MTSRWLFCCTSVTGWSTLSGALATTLTTWPSPTWPPSGTSWGRPSSPWPSTCSTWWGTKTPTWETEAGETTPAGRKTEAGETTPSGRRCLILTFPMLLWCYSQGSESDFKQSYFLVWQICHTCIFNLCACKKHRFIYLMVLVTWLCIVKVMMLCTCHGFVALTSGNSDA